MDLSPPVLAAMESVKDCYSDATHYFFSVLRLKSSFLSILMQRAGAIQGLIPYA